MSVYPAKSLTTDLQAVITDYTRKLARALHVKGLINIQFIVSEGQVYVIEVNPRSSRTVPYISKVTGIPIIELAVKIMNGDRLSQLGCGVGLAPAGKYYAVSMAVSTFTPVSIAFLRMTKPSFACSAPSCGGDWKTILKAWIPDLCYQRNTSGA